MTPVTVELVMSSVFCMGLDWRVHFAAALHIRYFILRVDIGCKNTHTHRAFITDVAAPDTEAVLEALKHYREFLEISKITEVPPTHSTRHTSRALRKNAHKITHDYILFGDFDSMAKCAAADDTPCWLTYEMQCNLADKWRRVCVKSSYCEDKCVRCSWQTRMSSHLPAFTVQLVKYASANSETLNWIHWRELLPVSRSSHSNQGKKSRRRQM